MFLPCGEQRAFPLGRTSLSHGKDDFGGAFIHVAGKQHTFLPLLENLNLKKSLTVYFGPA